MYLKSALALVFLISSALFGTAQQAQESNIVELDVLHASVGVWDAEFEVWPSGLDSPSVKFKGVETNRAFGKYWIASDLESVVGGQTIVVHSIVGYDLDARKLVAKIIDEGPYAATMTGEYDKDSRTVTWLLKGKEPSGKPIAQRTTLTQKSATERWLIMSVPSEKDGKYSKFMEIKFIKRS